jgi:tetratricopeptide (TPR) repeat protein
MGQAEAHHWYARQLSVQGRFAEAQRELHIAQQLDPLSLQISLDIGEAFYYARQYDQALRQWRQTLELDDNYPYMRYGMARAYRQKRMHKEALSELLVELPHGRHPAVLAELAGNYAALGQRDEALKIAAEMQERARQGYVGRLNMATLYLALGEREQALEWLEEAYAERHIRLIFLPVEPAFDSLRAEPRFAALLRRVGLR